MTSLRDLMHETVEHQHADMVRLAVRARSQGTTIRRRRHAAVSAGTLVVLAALGTGLLASGILGPANTGSPVADRSGATVVVPAPGGPLPVSARSGGEGTPVPEAARALVAAVTAVASGTISDVEAFRSPETLHHPAAVSAVLDFAAAAGEPPGQVAVLYLPGAELAWAGGAAAYLDGCDRSLQDCRMSTLPDGSTVRSYLTRGTVPGGGWEVRVVERLVGDAVISVQDQGPRADDADGTVLGPPALTQDQLLAIAARLTFVS